MISMAKRKRKPYQPPVQGDTGPDTAAQRAGSVLVEISSGGGIIRRKRHDHVLTTMLRQGHIQPRHAAAGLELFSRWEDTWRSPDLAWTRVYVDASPRPGDVSIASLEAKARWVELSRVIKRECRAVVMAVCCHRMSIYPDFTKNSRRIPEYRKMLTKTLDDIAKILRMR
jgi:hypothetical protein